MFFFVSALLHYATPKSGLYFNLDWYGKWGAGQHELTIFSISLVITVILFTKKSLSGFNKPGHPIKSGFIRRNASRLSKVGLISASIISLYILIIFSFAYLGFFISGRFHYLGLFDLFTATALEIYEVSSKTINCFLSGTLSGIVLSAYLTLHQIPKWELGDGLDDVEDTVKRFRKLDQYDSLYYLDVKKGCFVGRDIKGSPIYIPWEKLLETHLQVLGTTGSGKGLVTTLIASQCIIKGESVIWFDPKWDRHSPRILSEAASEVGKKFHFLNLNADQPAQFNLIANCTENEIEELLVAGFDLRTKGSDGDFYRSKDEDAASLVAKISANENVASIPELLEICAHVNEVTEQENFWRMFKKLASLSAINTNGGIDLQDAILNGEVLYIVGSCDNERVKMLQKMLLVRVMQIIKKRDRSLVNQAICVVLDEFKHLISPTSLNALGVVRDFDAHFILAHQSLGDLEECSGVNPASAYGAVVDNTSIKIVYRINDANHAELMAKLSGMKKTYVESTSKSDELRTKNTTSWREAHKYYVSPDLFTHLPIPSDRKKQAGVGVLFGIGNAKILHVGIIESMGEMPKVTSHEPVYTPLKKGEFLGSELI